MYICGECGAIFDEPDYIREQICSDPEAWEDIARCPNCHSEGFEEARECAECGDYFTEDDLIGGHLCEDCLHELEKDAKLLKDYILSIDEGMDDFADWYFDTYKRRE